MSYLAAVLADSPFLYWRLGDAPGSVVALDASGNARDGVLDDANSTSVAGLAAGNNARRYTGPGSPPSLAITTSVSFGPTAAMTTECWFAGTGVALNLLAGTSTAGLNLVANYPGAGDLSVVTNTVESGVTHAATVSGSTFDDGLPHHIVGTASGGVLTLYLDGASVATGAYTPGDTFADSIFFTGTAAGPYTLDEVALYVTALAPARIAAHYVEGLSMLSATYDATRNRVVLAVTGLGGTTARVLVERFEGAVLSNPVTIRGGDLDPHTSAPFTMYDQEFSPGVLLTYRVRSFTLADAVVDTFTATITVAQTVAWLRSPARPFLDRPVTIIDWSSVENAARGGVLEVIGRRAPVAVTEVRGARRFTLTLRAADRDEADALETFLSFGDVVFLQVPLDCLVPGSLYAFVGDTSCARAGRHDGGVYYVTLPLTEVSAPDPAIVGYTITYFGVKAAWATYADLLADPLVPTYLALQQYVSSPADEITG